LLGSGAGPQNYTKISKGVYHSMKTLTAKIAKFISSNGYFVFVFILSVVLGNLVSFQSRMYENKLKQKDVELVELRNKINNHLMAESFYDKPAKVVIPVMKDFGIDL
jgi:hypothetical protein